MRAITLAALILLWGYDATAICFTMAECEQERRFRALEKRIESTEQEAARLRSARAYEADRRRADEREQQQRESERKRDEGLENLKREADRIEAWADRQQHYDEY